MELKKLIERYNIPKEIIISIEPGRDIFADVGEFIMRINRVQKSKGDNFYKIYVDGSYVFIPSAMIRKRKHQVIILDKYFKELITKNSKAKLCGCTTLSSDYLLPGLIPSSSNIEKGDYIIIKDIGAYGACQHMEFLNKRPASEILVKESKNIELISKRGDYIDKVRNIPLSPQKL